jgi:hypothetical protein
MLEYARKDTHFLLPLRRAMLRAISKRCKELQYPESQALQIIHKQCQERCLIRPKVPESWEDEPSAVKMLGEARNYSR